MRVCAIVCFCILSIIRHLIHFYADMDFLLENIDELAPHMDVLLEYSDVLIPMLPVCTVCVCVLLHVFMRLYL